MRNLALLAAAAIILLSATLVLPRLQGQSDAGGFELVAVHPHDPNAFTQGLYFEDGYLYEGTGRRGQSFLRKVEPETGTVVEEAALPPQFFGEGIAPFGDEIYQLTWTSGVGFVYGKESFDLRRQFAYSREGWGLTADETHLIMSDGSQYLYFLEPGSFQLVSQIEVGDASGPVRRLNELEYIEGYVFANVWYSNEILKIDPDSGRVVSRFDMSELVARVAVSDAEGVLNGIAYDEETGRIFVTGKLWPELFEISLR